MTSSSVAATVSERPGSSSAICSTVTRCERITGAQIARATSSPMGVVRLRTLHQRIYDMLLRMQATEMIVPCGRLALVVEDRRVARVGDEVRQVVALWQVAGERGGGVQHDDDGAGLELRLDRGRDLADCGIRHREHDHAGAIERGIDIQAVEAETGLQTLAAKLADLDMAHIEGGGLEIVGQPVAHLAAGTEERDRGHGGPARKSGPTVSRNWYNESMA